MFSGGAILLLNISNQSLTRPLCGHSQHQLPVKATPIHPWKECLLPAQEIFSSCPALISFIFMDLLNANSVRETLPHSLEQRRVDTCVLIAGLTWQINLNPSPSWEHHTMRIQKYSHLPSTSSLISMTDFLLTWGFNKLQCNYITVLYSVILLYSIP